MKTNYIQPSVAVTSVQTMYLMQYVSPNKVITGTPIGGDPDDAI